MKYDYAIQFPDGSYYNGVAGPGYKTCKPMEVFTYTEHGAHAKILRMGWDAVVVRYH